jgi:uncharacterized membrane protein
MGYGVNVIVASFEDEKTAKSAYQKLRKRLLDEKEKQTFSGSLSYEPDMLLQNVAVVSRTSRGRLKVKESDDMGGGKGALIGGVLGGIFGLMTGPVGWVAVGGALIGGLLAKKSDPGIPNPSLQKLGDGLEKGQAAVVAVVDERYGERMTDIFKDLGAVVTTEGLDESIVERLQESE